MQHPFVCIMGMLLHRGFKAKEVWPGTVHDPQGYQHVALKLPLLWLVCISIGFVLSSCLAQLESNRLVKTEEHE